MVGDVRTSNTKARLPRVMTISGAANERRAARYGRTDPPSSAEIHSRDLVYNIMIAHDRFNVITIREMDGRWAVCDANDCNLYSYTTESAARHKAEQVCGWGCITTLATMSCALTARRYPVAPKEPHVRP
jgi:hypothetical protein